MIDQELNRDVSADLLANINDQLVDHLIKLHEKLEQNITEEGVEELKEELESYKIERENQYNKINELNNIIISKDNENLHLKTNLENIKYTIDMRDRCKTDYCKYNIDFNTCPNRIDCMQTMPPSVVEIVATGLKRTYETSINRLRNH